MRFIFLSTLLWIFRFILLLWFLAVLLWLRQVREVSLCGRETSWSITPATNCCHCCADCYLTCWQLIIRRKQPCGEKSDQSAKWIVSVPVLSRHHSEFHMKKPFQQRHLMTVTVKNPFFVFWGGGFPPANQNLPLLGLSVCVLYLTKHYCRHSGSRRVSCLFTLPYFVTKFPLSATPLGSYLTIEISLLPTIMF